MRSCIGDPPNEKAARRRPFGLLRCVARKAPTRRSQCKRRALASTQVGFIRPAH